MPGGQVDVLDVADLRQLPQRASPGSIQPRSIALVNSVQMMVTGTS
jgi:hypothetical protein